MSRSSVFVALILLTGTPRVYAAPPAAPASAPNSTLTPEQKRKQAEQEIQNLRVYQLTELLKLDAATSTKFFAALARYDEQMKPLEEARKGAHKELRKSIEAEKSGVTVDTRAYQTQLTTLNNAEVKQAELRVKFRKELEGILTPRQVAQFVLWERDFERKLNRAMRMSGAQANPQDRAQALDDLKKAGRNPEGDD